MPTTLTTYLLGVFEAPFAVVREEAWYRITASRAPTGHLVVAVNGTLILNVSHAYHPRVLAGGGTP
ncbi:hypothetical protein CH063_09835 [Colletotrichum higginsianum]|uniref:RhaA is able to hydrolyze alpha-1 n=1 Tax=Colletotrichum higginsianum (strain IMI 349063) TaxID=759273 RepID=H1VF44_COLHI|nr:RhaA is able to hydrolyze alpha-1 [Colletotrichum higginsianum IMI 349063]OBR16328.1 RhaA is able to hydrolyze alpha-1 [Colletotrichum higginsianum IMI 349063]CCF38847.1 hypothetical protein CH063_09835 [Colletotrichum higginsianum]